MKVKTAFAGVTVVACFAVSLLFGLYGLSSDKIPSIEGLFHGLSWHGQHNAQADSGPMGQAATTAPSDEYLLGVGKADITGPVVEVELMGYASPSQIGTGLRQRLYSRAFIIGDVSDASKRFVYLVLDTQSGDTAVRYGILDGIAAQGSEFAVYNQSNVAVIGTHSHSGPAAWLNYLLPQITSKGFNKQSYQAIVDGAVLSIQRAHESLSPGSLSFGSTQLQNANINRSPYAYLANPEEERAKYEDDVDKTLELLRFKRASDQKNIGVLTWFPVHGTSMLNNNTLISGDNKGVAASLLEKSISGTDDAADDFVGGFSQSNVGDTSANILGAWCEDGSNQMCTFENSTCGGKNEPCHGRGPFFREKDQGASSCFEIGKRQADSAKALYDSLDEVGTAISGSVSSLHTFKDFSSYTFTLANGTEVTTCPAALGYSFAAGTTDGPGAFDFTQNNPNDPNASPVWAVVSGLLREPSEEQKKCHAPKPILLDVGEVHKPYDWTPNIVDIQLLRIGQLVMIISPGEATTMSGRRWKEAIKAHVDDLQDEKDTLVVLGGPANSYTHYIATEEEYGVQRYEGASTLYGPHTLEAYVNASLDVLPYLYTSQSKALDPGPEPPNNVNRSLNFISGVILDAAPIFKKFGDVQEDVDSRYAPSSVVNVSFVGANPRNNLRLEKTYAAVEKQIAGQDAFETIRSDADWSLIFNWRRLSEVLGTSEVTLQWHIDDSPGKYRLHYYGDAKTFTGAITAFEGVSGVFTVGD